MDYLVDENGKNVFFSVCFLGPTYYHINQISRLKRFESEDSNFFICINDSEMGTTSHRVFSSIIAEKELENMDFLITQVKLIFSAFDIKHKKLFVFPMSFAFKRIFQVDPDIIQKIFSRLGFYPNEKLIIPTEVRKDFFNKTGASYSLAFVLQKFLEWEVAINMTYIFAEELNKPINYLMAGYGSSVCMKIIEDIYKRQGILKENQIKSFFIENVPHLGHSEDKSDSYEVPDWNMNLNQIESVVLKYNFDSNRTIKLLKNLFWITGEFFDIQDQRRKLSELSENIPQNKKLRIIFISKNIFYFLQNIKKKVNKKEVNNNIVVNSKKQLEDIISIFKSKLALQILFYANGTLTLSEIGKKTKQNLSYVSRVSKKLREKGFIKVGKNGKIFRKIDSFKVEFPNLFSEILQVK